MVFTTTNLFKGIQCPHANQCKLTNCIFAHDAAGPQAEETAAATNADSQPIDSRSTNFWGEPLAKRRKITYDSLEDKPPSRADQIRLELAESRKVNRGAGNGQSQKALPSLTRPISPPSKQSQDASSPRSGSPSRQPDNRNGAPSKSDAEPKESLNPRLIPNDPAGHAKRGLFLKHLHGELVRLNKTVSDAQSANNEGAMVLDDQRLIKLALDEEEHFARDQPKLYSNVVKQRIALYKKMKADEWRTHLKSILERDTPKAKVKPLITGLSTDEELLILPYLVANQTGLENFGYVTSPPTDTEIAEAAAGVEASHNFESCDRCGGRFQVFPDRNDEGLLTSHGPCWHHPNKKVFPPKTKGDVASGLSKEPFYPCCGNVVGSDGCTKKDFHVFKTSSPARMAAVIPFITTPDNVNPTHDGHGNRVNAVTFDCEMGYTTAGLELIRLTAVSWPSNERLVDVLVRPKGTIIDLNSRFSGVWPETFTNAIPYDRWLDLVNNKSSPELNDSLQRLPVVESPQKARELLCSYLTPETPLIGHAIDNDLNAARLCHPSIVDTVLLFPHPRGLPLRYGLKALTSNNLGRSIQMGGDRGHDSLEDAQATGDLVRFKIGERWKVLHSNGWRIRDNQLIPPDGFGKCGLDGKTAEEAREARAEAVLGMDPRAANVAMAKRRGKRGAQDRSNGASESTGNGETIAGNGLASYLQHATRADDGSESRLRT